MDVLHETEMAGKTIDRVFRQWVNPNEYWTIDFTDGTRATLMSDCDHSDIYTDIQLVPYSRFEEDFEEMLEEG